MQGYVSIGCEPCTRPVLPGQQEREGRWWWEDAAAKECGLHKGNIEGKESAEEVRDSNHPCTVKKESFEDAPIELAVACRVRARIVREMGRCPVVAMLFLNALEIEADEVTVCHNFVSRARRRSRTCTPPLPSPRATWRPC